MLSIFNFFKRFQYLLPVFIITLYLSIIFFVRGELPSSSEFILFLKNAYYQHGYYVVFAGGFLEGNLLLGYYLPGTPMMLVGAAFSREGIIWFPYVLLSATAGLLIAYCINYFFGKYGWNFIFSKIGLQDEVDLAKQKIQHYGAFVFLLGYFSPGSAAFLSTAAGIIRMPFKRFLVFSIIAQTIWSIIWGSAAYVFGLPLAEFAINYFIFVAGAFVVFWLVLRLRKKKKT